LVDILSGSLVQWRSQHKSLVGAKSFDIKRAAVFCMQINSFFSGDYFYYIALA